MKDVSQIVRKYSKEFTVGLFVLLVYAPTFVWMWDRWFARDSYYSHGILIPFVSGYLIWQKKDIIAKLARESSPWGMKLFIAGLVIHLFSAFFRVYFSSGFSLILVLMGLALHFYGRKVFKEIAFPLAFLVFMVPLPMVVVTNLSFKLKMLASKIAAIILNNMRIPCIQDGSTIIMRHTHVVVDDVCSGIRSLISLMALGALFAYWMKAVMWKRVLLFALTIPIAVITNMMRVIFLASVSEIWGPQYASGVIHDMSGFAVFALAFGLLYVCEKTLE